MPKLRCVVERITYQNPENGYSVMKVKVKGYDDLLTLVNTKSAKLSLNICVYSAHFSR